MKERIDFLVETLNNCNYEYYILDTNSTNHTFINGTMIGSNSEMKLTSGDKVRLANEEFEFKFF